MGRASNRKKTQRQPGNKPPPMTEETLQTLLSGLQRMMAENDERQEMHDEARWDWCGDSDPVPAVAPQWVEGSLRHRFWTTDRMSDAQNGPSLATVTLPDATVIVTDPAHWNIAANALIRAVAFDDLGLDDPTVRRLLEILVPVTETELAYHEVADTTMHRQVWDWDEGEEFPELDGPVFLLGGCALVYALWAVLGEDSLSQVLGVLVPALEDAFPGLDGQTAADALIGAFATEYRCEQPGDDEVLARIKHDGGNALENLLGAHAIAPADVLPAGLAILSVLARLCQSNQRSILKRA